MSRPSCCILNNGPGGWAFETLARRLSAALWLEFADTPRDYNYLLLVEDYDPSACGRLFIPFTSIKLASDKRLQAQVFHEHFQTLEFLGQLMNADKLKLCWEGMELPQDPFGEDLASDWLSRCEGEPWPDEAICPVHLTTVSVEPVPICYGLIRHPLEYYRACKELFPLANAMIEGGCFVGSQKFQARPFCAECRKALAR